MKTPYPVNPKLDLILERTADVKPELVWKAWTTPKQLMKWFCPLPWKTVKCEMDLRPGGKFMTVMQGPKGQKFENRGCYLEVIKNRKLVWTAALLPGYRPIQKPENGADLLFTAIVLIEPYRKGTKYTAIAIHKDREDQKKHKNMGFSQGWGIAFDQLVAMVKKK